MILGLLLSLRKRKQNRSVQGVASRLSIIASRRAMTRSTSSWRTGRQIAVRAVIAESVGVLRRQGLVYRAASPTRRNITKPIAAFQKPMSVHGRPARNRTMIRTCSQDHPPEPMTRDMTRARQAQLATLSTATRRRRPTRFSEPPRPCEADTVLAMADISCLLHRLYRLWV